MSGEITTRTSRIWRADDGVMRAVLLPGADETVADARENTRVIASLLLDGRPCPLLIDAREMRSIERAARAYYGRAEVARNVSALAILIESPLSRMLGSFFLHLQKPLVPTRLFTSEPESVAWLRGFVK